MLETPEIVQAPKSAIDFMFKQVRSAQSCDSQYRAVILRRTSAPPRPHLDSAVFPGHWVRPWLFNLLRAWKWAVALDP